MRAFLLIQADDHATGLRDPLLRLPDVRIELADDMRGAFDAIALVSARTEAELRELVVPALRALPGVTHVLTAPIAGGHAAPLVAGAVRAA
jgi:hypothetical protein